MPTPPGPAPNLTRSVGLGGAVLLGLGSILGTGVFVTLGLAAEIAGPAFLLAIAAAGFLAWCNATSSARLAAVYPVSGGTYEYANRLLHPVAGFAAGWSFLCAKSASAATAALGVAGYLGAALDWAPGTRWGVACGFVVVMTLLVAGGIRRTVWVNAILVTMTLVALGALVAGAMGAPWAEASTEEAFWVGDSLGERSRCFLFATALVFVAFAGYARLAVLGEEVRDPERTIPRAIGATLGVTVIVYAAVAWTGWKLAGSAEYGRLARETAAPLEVMARGAGLPVVAWLLTAGALAALAGVVMNLLLGVSRVWLAMARRGDAPAGLVQLTRGDNSPAAAVAVAGAVVLALTATGSVRVAWTFSALTVLVYYALTNACALRLEANTGAGRVTAAMGLAGCLGLAVVIDGQTWLLGGAAAAVGALWWAAARWQGRTS